MNNIIQTHPNGRHSGQALRASAACAAVGQLTSSEEGREGLLAGLDVALRSSGALRAQLAALVSKPPLSPQRHLSAFNGALLLPSSLNTS